jgi:hypothetical protein
MLWRCLIILVQKPGDSYLMLGVLSQDPQREHLSLQASEILPEVAPHDLKTCARIALEVIIVGKAVE